ncbi:hypothetical protein DRH14_00740 [Candidatus Shapirobacteria bacterium]|nr:MAG: hypothetical protein DRH14_00740 [Candidatus Shapirobacteria bacterium]
MSSLQSLQTHLRTYRSALQSTHPVTISSLVNYYSKVKPILHPDLDNPHQISPSALIYTLLRLPTQIDHTQLVVLGQTPEVFKKSGYPNITQLPKVSAPARRRTRHFNQKTNTLATFITSISDIDDIVNILVSFQIEWNKIHNILSQQTKIDSSTNFPQLLSISTTDWQNLKTAFGPNYLNRLRLIIQQAKHMSIQLLAGSWIDYAKATQKWWKNIAKTVDPKLHISKQNIYFVSSNTHSLINLITGSALKHQSLILKYIQKHQPQLYQLWQQVTNNQSLIHPHDFLYFASKYLPKNSPYHKYTNKITHKLGIINIPASHYLNVNLQLIPVKSLLQSKYIDSRLKLSPRIKNNTDFIFNINYPLGFSAYHILSETLQNINQIKGLYIIGKAAVLNGEIGDIQIPRLAFDEHSQNSYLINNCFQDFLPFPNQQGSILTKQKAVTVLGTYLENTALLKKYSQNNLTIIEMESGPYLSAVTEATYSHQTPQATIVDLNQTPFDLGIINYTSDTPYSKAKNLGSLGLNTKGIEPVYLASLTVLQRIINQASNKT